MTNTFTSLTEAVKAFSDRYEMFSLPSISTQDEALLSTCDFVSLLNRKIETADTRSDVQQLEGYKIQAVRWLKDWIAAHPEDRQRLSDIVQGRVDEGFPWDVVRPPSTALAMLYNFSPFQDTGATVASKRLRDFTRSFDVIACSFLNKKKIDSTIEAIAEPYVNSKYFLPLNPSWASWEAFQAFVAHSNRAANSLLADGRKYDFVYSRAMWAPSIYAGAWFKMKHPEIAWVAEFSDPLSLDVEGLSRGGEIPRDAFSATLMQEIQSSFADVMPEDLNIFSLAEYLVYALADEIIFTNDNQRATMLEHVVDPRARARIEEVSSVSNHPTLPRNYYLREDSNYEVDDDALNLGYFGEFYSSRGITEVTAAIRSLPETIQRRVRLHVFTNYIPAFDGARRPRNFSQAQFDDLVNRALEGVGATGIEHLVRLNASLPYLTFLATTEKLDYLIVNDARSGEHHTVNPYLPSKWSDYAGSSAETWAFVESGSILSTKPATVKTPVGDVSRAREDLWTMVVRKFPELEDR